MCISDFRALAEPADFTILADRIVIWPEPVKRKRTAKTVAYSNGKSAYFHYRCKFQEPVGFHGKYDWMAAQRRSEPDELKTRKSGAICVDAPLENYSNLAAEAGTALLDFSHLS